MKAINVLSVLILLVSCAPKQNFSEIKTASPELSFQKGFKSPSEILPLKTYQTVLKCDDSTITNFNKCGIEALPFLRPVFFDFDNDGSQEMIAGSKDGSLRLYKNNSADNTARWNISENYFAGIKSKAFSSPAAGDINNDGNVEILIGTGGFSSDSGKVIIYKNTGTPSKPVWEKINMPEINVANDAAPALFDIDNDGRLDIIVGNSSGSLFLFRNRSIGSRINFVKDPDYFKTIKLGMYVVPAATSFGNRIIIIAGNDAGNLYILEKTNGKESSWKKDKLKVSFYSFAAPSFIETKSREEKDLVISDGNGQLFYYKNIKKNYREWEEDFELFSSRILPGPACTPAMSEINGAPFMTVGNANGEIKLYEYISSAKEIPWIERSNFFKGIKLQGFSKGILTSWNGKDLLITGQQNGILKAFINSGTIEKTAWVEQNTFFRTMPGIIHAAPAVFDIDGDGRWELIIGDVDGNVSGFRYKTKADGMPEWEKIDDSFKNIKVKRYASPALFKDADKIYLLVGQQDGRINTFVADAGKTGMPVFYRNGYLGDIQLNNHSSPAVFSKNGIIEISIGDYNGNLKHFTCKNDLVEIKAN